MIDINIKIQKKLYPSLTESNTYKLLYNTSLEKGTFLSGISSSPSFSTIDENTLTQVDGVYFEEAPSSTSGVESVSIVNPGYSYQFAPSVTINGDGSGATAQAVVVNGVLREIKVLNKGTGYTSAIVKITNAKNDTTGTLGAAVATLEGKYGTLRTYYNTDLNVKTVSMVI